MSSPETKSDHSIIKKIISWILNFIFAVAVSVCTGRILANWDPIKEWITDKSVLIIFYSFWVVVGGLIGWKFFQIINFFKWLFSKIWKVICTICKWFKIIFTINKLEARVSELSVKNVLHKQFDKKKITDAINSKIRAICQRCNHNNFKLFNGYYIHCYNRNEKEGFIYSIAVVCSFCGHINFYTLEELGLDDPSPSLTKKQENNP
jgi:hypothetical protein